MPKLLRRVLVALVLLPLSAGVAAAFDIEEVTSPGGLKAWLVHEPSIPVIAVEFSFADGAASEEPQRKGIANMVSSLLDEGAGDMDSLAFQTRLQDLSIRMGFDAGRDGFYGSLKTLTRNRDEAFRLLRLAMSQPRFDADPVERMRNQIMTSLRREQRDPDSIASDTWFRLAFQDHPYALPTSGTLDSVTSITVDDLRDYVARAFNRGTLKIAVVGDITAAELGPLLDETFGVLPDVAPGAPPPEAALSALGRVQVVDFNVPQSRVVFGSPGIKRNDPDWYAAYILNYVLGGGGLTSRLTDEVRERRGLAYSVYSYLLPLDHGALLMGGVGTQNERVVQALQLIREEIRKVRENGITADELADAKTYINGSFPLGMISSDRIARLLLSMQRNDLGIDYLDRRAELMNAVTLEDVKRVAERLLHPDRLFVVVVGKPEGLADSD